MGCQYPPHILGQESTHCFSGVSVNPSRAWKTPMLLTYWMSPFSKLVDTLKRSPRKCSASRASACASVMGGMSALRGSAPNPTKYRLAYCRTTLSGLDSVAGWWYRSGRLMNRSWSPWALAKLRCWCQLLVLVSQLTKTYFSTSQFWLSVWMRSGLVEARWL